MGDVDVAVRKSTYRVYEDGMVLRTVHGIAFNEIANGDFANALREVARLQEENRRLREEGIRDAMRILFGECKWGVATGGRGVLIYYPPGFALPQEQTISGAAMADALTDALLPLVP